MEADPLIKKLHHDSASLLGREGITSGASQPPRRPRPHIGAGPMILPVSGSPLPSGAHPLRTNTAKRGDPMAYNAALPAPVWRGKIAVEEGESASQLAGATR